MNGKQCNLFEVKPPIDVLLSDVDNSKTTILPSEVYFNKIYLFSPILLHVIEKVFLKTCRCLDE